MNFKNTALTACISLAIHSACLAKQPAVPDQSALEKCYGIAKAGLNDCGAATHQCAGEAKVKGDPNEWLFVPVGLCNKIVGGSLKPAK